MTNLFESAQERRLELAEMKVPELKQLAADHGVGGGLWRRDAKKADLINGIIAAERGDLAFLDSADQRIAIDRDLPPEADEADEKPAPRRPRATDEDQGILTAIIDAIDGKINAGIDEDHVKSIAQAVVNEAMKTQPVRVEIQDVSGNIRDAGAQHKTFPKLMRWLSTGVPVWLVGPAGTGKSRACREAAKALDIPFYCQSASEEMTVDDLFGFTNQVTGDYQEAPLYHAVKNGGLFCLDEIDKSNANVLASINYVTEAGTDIVPFPCGIVEKHKDFRFVATANTFGLGPDSEYVGSLQIDAATLDRFAYIEWDIDEDLEATFVDNEEWTATVRKARAAAKELGIKTIISPRATIKGALGLAAGEPVESVIESCILRGMDESSREKIRPRLN